MGNMTVFILGIALLSVGTYLMRLGGQNSATDWRCQTALRLCFQMRQRFCCFPSRWRPLSMKVSILPVWRAYWAWRLQCFWHGEKCR